MISRKTANGIALAIFLLLLVGGINLIIAVGPTFDSPDKRTTVVESSTGSGTGKETRATEEGEGKEGKSRKSTTTVEAPTGSPAGKKTVTVETGSRSFLERALGESGLIGLQVAVVILASFLAAALVQRALVGDFALKLGNVIELSALQEATTNNTVALTAEVADLQKTGKEQKAQLEALAQSVLGANKDSAELARAIVQQQEELGDARRRIASIEDKV
jgi:hypothetical protein